LSFRSQNGRYITDFESRLARGSARPDRYVVILVSGRIAGRGGNVESGRPSRNFYRTVDLVQHRIRGQ
jgi:hypothetical protein